MEQGYEKEMPQVVWAPDGKRFAYFQGGEIMLYDVAAKTEKTYLLVAGRSKRPRCPLPGPARFDWQNRRVSEDSLEWGSLRQAHAVERARRSVSFSLDTGTWEQLTATPEPETRSQAFPDGSRVAFRRGSDL